MGRRVIRIRQPARQFEVGRLQAGIKLLFDTHAHGDKLAVYAVADPSEPAPPVDHVANAREFQQRGDFVHARDELLLAYEADPDVIFRNGFD